jgi:small-conductance mechanosensitive channel
MGIRTTVARSRDDEEIIIPNATLEQNAVKNFTYQDSIYRLRAQVGVAYDSDMRRVMDTLRRAADALDWRVKTKQPLIFMSAFGDSSVTFEVSVWMNDPWRAPQARSDLMEAIWWALKEAGITIAFPQVDVHFDPDVVAAVHAMGSGPDGASDSSSSPHRS